ncbi:hypothetical protein [Chryseobacterium sp. ZHDP1]|uniref:hypothetical protein n=1 Tax=Chryseobacterium sp. ZHDP1 TaxID=2838877 RepID=UPI001BE0C10B|nr:hypothetical protein [Chryseobacterium sp. ZHDP1]QWA38856.1 hypothetical protein KKI44_01190 [Chryseobacterium sp. ZHDP1]
MKDNKLKNLKDFCLNTILNSNPPYNPTKMLTQISSYIGILERPISLGLFVPCDINGKYLKPPVNFEGKFSEYKTLLKQYTEAQDRVMFEGFEIRQHDWPSKKYELGLYHKDYEWSLAQVTPEFRWGYVNIFKIEDITLYSPNKNLFTFTENALKYFT